MAADQDDEGYLTWLSKKVERAQRPPFVKIARARLTRDFAVLLMRTSYQVCCGEVPVFVEDSVCSLCLLLVWFDG